MDLILYSFLNKKIGNAQDDIETLQDEVDNVTLAYTYKGSVATVSDLPNDAQLGDLYTVNGDQYVWDGTSWVVAGAGLKITNQQIDSIFS